MIPFGDLHWSDVKGRPSWRWATVTATSPALALVVDGDEAPIGVEPTVLAHVGPLTVGTRVWCQVTPGGAVVAVGRAGPPLLRPLPLAAGWAWDTSFASPPPTFMIDASRIVHLSGRVAPGAGATTDVAMLPVAARPSSRHALLTIGEADAPHRITVFPSGRVLAPSPPPEWLSLSGLSFPAAR